MKNTVIKLAALFILFQGMFMYANFSFVLEEIWEDYQLHQVKYGDNLTTFLSKHYGELKESHQEQHKKEHQEHQHHHELNVSFQLDMLWDNSFNFDAKNSIVFYKQNNFTYKDLFSTFEKQKIFQPPRV